MAKIKLEKPTVFRNYFGKYGMDIEFKTTKQGAIIRKSCRFVFHDPKEKKTLRGTEAEKALSKSPVHQAAFMKAGANEDIKKMQIRLAKELYMNPSENAKVGSKIKVIKVAEGGEGGSKDIEGAENIKNYKKTDEYKTNLKNGHITEIDLDLTNLKLGDIMESEKERAALYGTYINSPGYSLKEFRNAIIAIIKEKGLTTEEQVKSIDPVELLKESKKYAKIKMKDGTKKDNKIHIKRINDAISSEDLSK